MTTRSSDGPRKQRPEGFDLAAALADPSFVPRAADADAVVALTLEAERGLDDAKRGAAGPAPSPASPRSPAPPVAALRRALVALGDAAVGALARARTSIAPADLPRLARVTSRLAAHHQGPPMVELAAALAREADPRARKLAADALGKLGPGALAPLREAHAREQDPRARAAFAEALSRSGEMGAPDATAGAVFVPPVPTELSREGRLALARAVARRTDSALRLDAPPSQPRGLVLRVRAGLESLALAELARLGMTAYGGALRGAPVPVPERPGLLEATLVGAPARVFESRVLLSFAFALPELALRGEHEHEHEHEREEPGSDREEALARAIASVLASPESLAVLREHTEGPLRYRLELAHAGKRRGLVKRVAELAAERAPELVNDPAAGPWTARVDFRAGRVRAELEPRGADARFAYREADVQGASHPTVAAALVELAGARPDDVVWDPFVGSGLELCERALRGPSAALVGSDLDPRALEAARANLAKVGAAGALLLEGDARHVRPPRPVTALITNPPLGRRVLPGRDLEALFGATLANARRWLAPGARVVWVSPLPAATRAAAVRLGLSPVRSFEFDLGGFRATAQRFDLRR